MTCYLFRSRLESIHGTVHLVVGGGDEAEDIAGTMATALSPKDPIFWLHHSYLDKLWNYWQKQNEHNPARNPAFMNLKLRPPPIFARIISRVIDIKGLAYEYL